MNKGNKFSKFKYLLFFLSGFIIILIVVIGLGRLAIGNVAINYFQVAGIYFEVIKTKRDNQPVIEQLKHPDYKTQFDAILEITRKANNSAEIKALSAYLKSPETHKNMKEMAIWALGEMKVESALDLLIFLQKESDLDKYEINKAIKKIKKEYDWRERIGKQFE